MRLAVKSPEEMEAFAAGCAEYLPAGFNLYLQGELGAGKTTFVRGVLRGLGYRGIVKSPTYTLVECYRVADRDVFHLDLYRLAAATELDDIGCRDYFDGHAVCLVEWPARGRSSLPVPDLLIEIAINQTWRDLNCLAHTVPGEKFLQRCGAKPLSDISSVRQSRGQSKIVENVGTSEARSDSTLTPSLEVSSLTSKKTVT